jgi:hypothetical protein
MALAIEPRICYWKLTPLEGKLVGRTFASASSAVNFVFSRCEAKALVEF